jgi:hypothetical protein
LRSSPNLLCPRTSTQWSPEKSIEFRFIRLNRPDDPSFIDQQRYGNRGNPKEIQGIDHHGPVHPVPLHEKAGTIRMLFFNNPQHLDPTVFLKRFCLSVPPGHMLAAPGSPGRPDVYDPLLPLKILD